MSRQKLRGIALQMLRTPWVPIRFSLDEYEAVWDEVEGVIVEDTFPILLSVANDELAEIRQRLPGAFQPGGGGVFEGWSDEELNEFRDQLRKIWAIAEQENLGKHPDTSQLRPIWDKWFKTDAESLKNWFLEPLAGKLIPRPENIRAVAGRVLIHNSSHLASCANPACGRLFLKARSDNQYCLEKACLRYGNKMRNRKMRANKSKLTRATRPRKGRQQ